MAQIPQPQFLNTGMDYRQQQLQQQGLRAQQVGQFANVMQENRRLAEDQRQFDVRNVLDYAQNVVKTQHGGDWANYLKNDPTAESTFQAIWGPDKGTQMFNQTVTAINDPNIPMRTKGQIMENVMRRAFIEGVPRDGGGGGVAPEPGVTPTPVRDTNPTPQPQPSKTINKDLNPNLMSAAERLQGNVQVGINDPTTQQTEGGGLYPATVASPDVSTIPGREVGRPEGEQKREDYATQANAVASRGGMPVNASGFPIATGQEQADLPINTQTIEQVWSSVSLPQNAGPGQIATTLKQAVLDAGGSQEAADFMGKGTAYLTDNKGDDEAEWAEFDEKARRLFGVDGDTLYAVRNQMFDNVAKGRPTTYMPPEGSEDRNQPWWSGKNIQVQDRIRDVVADPEATDASMVNALSSASSVDLSSLNGVELANIGQLVDKADKRFRETMIREPEYHNFVAKEAGLPESSGAQVQEALSMVDSAENAQALSKSMNDNPRKRRIVQRTTDHLSSAFTPRTYKQVGDHRYVEKAREQRENGEQVSFVGQMGITRERYEQIAQELYGNAPLSPEVEAVIPLEERQFTEAKRQFDENMKLTREQMPSAELRRKEMALKEKEIDIAAGRLALEEMKLNMAKEQLEAIQNGEAPPDYSLAYDLSHETYKMYMENILENNETPEEINAAVTSLLQTNEHFKSAHDNMMNIGSMMTGLPIEEFTTSIYKTNGWREFWKLGPKETGESATFTNFSTGTPYTVAPTVNVGPAQSAAGGGAGSGGGGNNVDDLLRNAGF